MAHDDRTLLELIGDTSDLVEVSEFRHLLVDALRRAVRTNWAALNDIGVDAETIEIVIDPPMPAELMSVFTELAYQNPLIQHYEKTRDGRATRISDVTSREAFHRLPLYQRFYRPARVEYQMAFMLPHVSGRILGVALCREHEDFTDAERDMIEAARPFLIQAYRNAIRYSEALRAPVSVPEEAGRPPSAASLQGLGLTRRQSEVLAMAIAGVDVRMIGAQLAISHRTVQKHLELSYRALGVDSLVRAAAVAWNRT